MLIISISIQKIITYGLAHRFNYNDETMLINISKKLGYFKTKDASDTSAL